MGFLANQIKWLNDVFTGVLKWFPSSNISITLPPTLPLSTQALTIDSSGQISYSSPTVQIQRLSFTNSSLVNGFLSYINTFGVKFTQITISDESNSVIAPDNITYNSDTLTTIDLRSIGTISGTYNLVAIGYALQGAGNGQVRRFSFTNADLVNGFLSYINTFGVKFIQVIVSDEGDNVFAPDNITYNSDTLTTIDLRSIGTISGTYNLVAIG